MSDTRETLRKGVGEFRPQPDAYERVQRRRDRRERNRKIAVIVVVAVISLPGALAIADGLRSAPTVADEPPRPSVVPSNGAVAFSATYLEVGRPHSRKVPRDLYVTPEGGEPIRVAGSDGDGVDQGCPAYSPDGTKLAYVERRDDDASIILADVGADGVPSGSVRTLGTGPWPVTSQTPGAPRCPVWSPDGSRLAFVAGNDVIRLITLDGRSTELEIPSQRGRSYGYALTWSSDGSNLAVVTLWAVWIVPVDGRDPFPVWTSGERGIADAIAWAPEGTRLAIGGRIGPWNTCCAGSTPWLRIIDVAEGTASAIPIEGDPQGRNVDQLSWPSPDRLFAWLDQGASWLVDPTGASEPAALEPGPFVSAASSIVVSPDRLSLLYVAYDGSSLGLAIAAQPVDGRSVPILLSPWTFGLYTNFGDLSWQPVHR